MNIIGCTEDVFAFDENYPMTLAIYETNNIAGQIDRVLW